MQPTLTIGELSQLTGVTSHTLRIWEKRYDALRVLRLESGHRRYPKSEVERIRAVKRALEKGFKPREVSPCDLMDILSLIGESSITGQDFDPKLMKQEPPVNQSVLEWLTATDYFDETGLVSLLKSEWDQKGPLLFLSDCVGPFLRMVGLRWEKKELSIAQEHFGSDVLSGFLSTQWRKLNRKNKGRPVVLTTLPGEPHGLGVLMCAVATAYAGKRVISLGVNTPIAETVRAVKRSQAVALGLSISSYYSSELAGEFISALYKELPEKTALWVGGSGRPEIPGGVATFENWETFFLFIKNKI